MEVILLISIIGDSNNDVIDRLFFKNYKRLFYFFYLFGWPIIEIQLIMDMNHMVSCLANYLLFSSNCYPRVVVLRTNN